MNKKQQARQGAAFFFEALVALFRIRVIISETLFLANKLSIPEEWDPPKLDDSSNKAVGRTVNEVDSHSKNSFIGSNMSDKRCWIPANDIRLIGCGHDGTAFGATMNCSDFTSRVI